MGDVPGWQQDPEREDQEGDWSGSARAGRVRPAVNAGSPHVPEHVPDLQRAFTAATADIDAVEDRLSALFDRAEGSARRRSAPSSSPPPEGDPDDEIIELFDHGVVVDAPPGSPLHEAFAVATVATEEADDEDGALAELDAALAAETPEPEPEPAPEKRGLFRRRS